MRAQRYILPVVIFSSWCAAGYFWLIKDDLLGIGTAFFALFTMVAAILLGATAIFTVAITRRHHLSMITVLSALFGAVTFWYLVNFIHLFRTNGIDYYKDAEPLFLILLFLSNTIFFITLFLIIFRKKLQAA